MGCLGARRITEYKLMLNKKIKNSNETPFFT